MGRGRQKAKHAKVARELKYYSPETNYQALERELASKDHSHVATERTDEVEDEELEDWKSWTESR